MKSTQQLRSEPHCLCNVLDLWMTIKLWNSLPSGTKPVLGRSIRTFCNQKNPTTRIYETRYQYLHWFGPRNPPIVVSLFSFQKPLDLATAVNLQSQQSWWLVVWRLAHWLCTEQAMRLGQGAHQKIEEPCVPEKWIQIFAGESAAEFCSFLWNVHFPCWAHMMLVLNPLLINNPREFAN